VPEKSITMNGRSILITGGTGSFGRAFVKTVMQRFPDIKRLVIFSRDEMKQFEMAQEFSEKHYPAIRYFIGDVRDRSRLCRALHSIDTVIHAAALKQVPAAEYNPMEFIQTNILGAANVVEACIDSGVQRVIALSTDKAAAPINLYGATKLCSDKLFVAANNYSGSTGPRMSVVRYGNVMGSRGSVIPLFLAKAKEGVLPITDSAMTRFNISMQEGVDMVFWTIAHALSGEIFVPKIPSYRIVDVAQAIGPSCCHEIVGVRPGEKIHEEMITESDSFNTVDLGRYYAILPARGRVTIEHYAQHMPAKPVEVGFAYNSGRNQNFLNVEQLRALIREHIDPAFQPV
jgi:UDP-N-acetylglucosamine 4,6-dehydratase (inverting)